jgi:hypothetical protein
MTGPHPRMMEVEQSDERFHTARRGESRPSVGKVT